MKINELLYIALNLILLQLISLELTSVNQFINVICALGILTFGVAHGAIDNILYGAKTRDRYLNFIIKYVLLIILFVGIWLLFPKLAFVAFLAVSSYHFGQSQFSEYNINSKILPKLLYLSWGGLILLLLIHFNGMELLSWNQANLQFFLIIEHLISYSLSYVLFFGFAFLFVFIWLLRTDSLPTSALWKETYILMLAAVSFYLMPLFIAFSLFFVCIHSLKVIAQEFAFCKTEFHTESPLQFARLFMPLTLTSLVGTLVIISIAVYFDKAVLVPYILLILLSSVTMPHSIVMEKFYNFSLPSTKLKASD